MIHFEYVNDSGKRIASIIEKEQLSFDGDAVIFVGALGICVRKILPMVNDKYTDPAVICIDSTGRYVIPVLSGHVGGANALARHIAMILGGEAVITTQSDNTGLWALDTLAKTYGWGISPLTHEEMNAAIAAFVNKRATALILECDDEGAKYLRQTCPEHVRLFSSFRDYDSLSGQEKASLELLVIVSPYAHDEVGSHSDVEAKHLIKYFPHCLHLGVGCQKQAPSSVADSILDDVRKAGYAIESIASVGTIALKKDEPCLSRLAMLLPWTQTSIYSAEELAGVDVPNPSEKVFEVTGCYGVAEASAMMMAKQRAAYAHSAGDGMDKSVLVLEKQKGNAADGGSMSHYTFALSADSGVLMADCADMQGHIEIVGAGPGDPDLVSVRGRKFLESADLILYAGSLVPRELTLCAKPGCVVRSSANMDLEEQFALMKEFYDRGKLVVRLHTGDPCIYGAIQEQMAFFDQYGMDYHITPGISSFLAAAAELRSQFTIPERCQSIILTRGEGRTPMPEKEKLHLLAEHQSTMCIFLSASIVDHVQQELLDGGYPPETPVAACYKLTWKDQRIYRGQLRDLASILKDNNLTLTTMIVVGEAIDNRQGLSKLYDGHFTHMFRKGKS